MFYVLFYISVVAVSDNSNKCKNPWKKVNPLQGCYMFVKDPKATWNMARSECMSHGGDLLSLTDEAERVCVVHMCGYRGGDRGSGPPPLEITKI